MTDTYSSRPFISHDGPDANGVRAEVKVVTGVGDIASVEPSEKGKSAKVSFSVSNTRYNSSGWAPVDDDVMKLVEAAQKAGEPVHFRIETRRQNKVDRTTPIEDLSKDATTARDNVHKSLAAAKRISDTEWTVSQYAMTNMAEDPTSGGGSSANDYTAEQLQEMSGNAPSINTKSRSKRLEGLPFDLYNPGGELNPGSAAVAVPLNLYSFLVEYLKDNGIEVSDKVKFLTVRAMLKACNDVQMAIYDGALTKPDLIAGSHTRARALIFESTRSFCPLTEENMTDVEKLQEWITKTVAKTTAMWRWSMNEVEGLLR